MALTLDFNGRWRGPKSLGTATLGTAWATVGTSDFKTGGAQHLVAFLDVTINSSVDVRVRLRSTYESGGSAYFFPIATVNASDVVVEDEYAELNVDADQKQSIAWELFGCYPYCTLEASVGTAGGTAAVLNAANIVTGI